MNSILSGFRSLVAFYIESKERYKGKERRKRRRRYGEIKTSLISYITPQMLVLLGIVAVIVFVLFETAKQYYLTNIPLNSIILSTAVFGIFMTFRNNYVLYGAAIFLKRIEKVIAQDVPDPKDIGKLWTSLERSASLLNTSMMEASLRNLREFGHPNFTDNTARLIKSKLGFRVTKNRSMVGFLSGILVMLGLLGTFLGLLKTIDAVGAAMGSMANIGGGDEGGEIGMEEMSGFIGGLAAPLQGMGLAFSTSLFGLSGSLLVGVFNHLGERAQNLFMEDASRWIDNRIPKYHPKKDGKDLKKVGIDTAADQRDLKTWLTGFVEMSVKTNKRLGEMVQAMSESIEVSNQSNKAIENMSASQEKIQLLTGDISENVSVIRSQGEEANEQTKAFYDSFAKMHDHIQNIEAFCAEANSKTPLVLERLDMVNENTGKAIRIVSEKLDEVGHRGDLFASALKEIHADLHGIQGLCSSAGNMIPTVIERLDAVNQNAQKSNEMLYEKLDKVKAETAASSKNIEACLQAANDIAKQTGSSVVENLAKMDNNASQYASQALKNAESLNAHLQESLGKLNENTMSSFSALLKQLEVSHVILQKTEQGVSEKLDGISNFIQKLSGNVSTELSSLNLSNNEGLSALVSQFSIDNVEIQKLNKEQLDLIYRIQAMTNEQRSSSSSLFLSFSKMIEELKRDTQAILKHMVGNKNKDL